MQTERTIPANPTAADSNAGRSRGPKRLLDPIDRVSELLFGLIMVLTFTGSLSVAEAGRDEVRTMLIGALGCNLAWGIIDAVFFLMGCMAERGANLKTLRAVRSAADPESAHRLIADALPPVVASILKPAEFELLHERIRNLPEPSDRGLPQRQEWLGGLAVFAWVFVSTFPVVIPFIVMKDAVPALRVSNGIAIAMLFMTGFAFGRCAGRHPWIMGAAMLLLGIGLVAMTIALGG